LSSNPLPFAIGKTNFGKRSSYEQQFSMLVTTNFNEEWLSDGEIPK